MSGDAEQRATVRIAVALGATTVSALALAVVYLTGGQTQLEGIFLAIALGGLGYALVVAARGLLPQGPFTEDRHPLASTPDDIAAVAHDFEAVYDKGRYDEAESAEGLARRRLIGRMFAGAVGALGVAALFPIASLGPRPGNKLFRTQWRKGSRVVSDQGEPVKASDLDVGEIIAVFPEGHVGSADSQTLLIRLSETPVTTRPGRETWGPAGYVAYSKVCTHAGCPVGLYQQAIERLLCPCHQSTFEVSTGATPVFGPATRPLPQLPLMVDAHGYLCAQRDFDQPIGPGFWNRDR
ncbi:MAG: Rieske 2Fe-2S domain-containing protein [Acidimicrobiia bacterium]